MLDSLKLGYDLLFFKARQFNEWAKENLVEDYIADLEARIVMIRSKL